MKHGQSKYEGGRGRQKAAAGAMVAVVLGWLGAWPATAEVVRAAHVEVELIAPTQGLEAGTTATVGLRMKMDKGWHTYWKNPGDSGLPTQIEWQLPEGFEAGPIQWLRPESFELGGLVNYGYEGEIVLPVGVAVPKGAGGGEVTLKAKVSYLACADVCVPGEAEISLQVPIVTQKPATEARWAELFAKAQRELPTHAAEGRLAAFGQGERVGLSVGRVEGSEEQVGGQLTMYFYPEEADQIEAAAKQEVEDRGQSAVLWLTPAKAATGPLERLRGVLVIEGGKKEEILAVDVPVGAKEMAAGDLRGRSPAKQAGDTSGEFPWVTMMYAFLGGILLNLMPCVFPVLSIKILGFVRQSGVGLPGAGVGRVRWHGVAFGLGVMVSFWLLTAVLIGLRAGGEQLGWGFQLQRPWFVAVMAMLLFGVGLNLLGVFEVGLGVMSAAGTAAGRAGQDTLAGSFLTGVLATAVATPCTAPLMGPAVGLALTLPALDALAIFTALGAGMAGPYVLLSMFPGWLRVLPRPGAWMETFKQLMSFPMFAAAIWLVWVYGRQLAGADGMMVLLLGLLLLAVGLWVLGRWSTPQRRQGVRRAARLACGFFLAVGIYLPLALAWAGSAESSGGGPVARQDAGEGWEAYGPGKLEELRAQGRTVFVDFTADWCLTCKFNERTVLASSAVRELFARHQVALLKADWTRRDEVVTKALEVLGRSSVPLYVVYGPGAADPVVLPTLLSTSAIAQAIGEVQGNVTHTTDGDGGAN
ncbi:MAG: thioredoxin family protein [Phycisphaeraceae bacterium]|nr:thioredoxin family protein [Phycisphaeraceae bacterium]